MQVPPIKRYPRREAAQLIVAEANKLVECAGFFITRDPVEESERNRGVGDYAVWFQRDDCCNLTWMDKEKAERVLDQAEARAAVAELVRLTGATHPLAQTWWLNPDNAPARTRFS